MVTLLNDAIARNMGGFSNAVSADDTDPAFVIWYDGSETTATVSVHSVVANTMRLIYGSTTTDFLLSNAAYNTYGELQDAVNALEGWHFQRIGRTRANNTYSSTLRIVAFGATNAKTSAGVVGYIDTSNEGNRSLGVGVNWLTAGLDNQTTPAAARQPANTIPYASDPTYDNYSPDDGTPKYSVGYGALFTGGTFVGTHAGNATWTITKCTDAADGETFVFSDTAATTGVKSVIGDDVIGAAGIGTNAGWIVVTVSAGGTITSSTLSVNGNILYAGGI